jgi:predicted phosphodiesterase
MGEIRVIYVTGDTHGEMQRFRASELRRLEKGDTLIICGDFGFLWDGGEQEEKNLQKIGKMKYNVLFLDGTHENFDLLGKYPVEEWNGGKVRHISGGLYHLMRGQVYSLGGRKLFTFGGGESAEKQIRMEAKKWWPCEMPSLEEMREGVDNLRANDFQVDYIFTHEPPPQVDFAPGMLKTVNRNQLEAYFGQVMKQTKYKKWFFGSQHIDRKITYKNYAVFSGVVPVEDVGKPKHFFNR